MVNDRLLLGIVAFGVSVGLSLLARADFSQALITGLISLPATYLAVLLVNWRITSRFRVRLAALQQQIRSLMERREDVYYELLELTEARDRLATSLQSTPSSFAPRGFQAPPPPPLSHPPLSWDLSNRQMVEATIAVPSQPMRSAPNPSPAAELQSIYAEAAATQREIEAKVKRLRTELMEKHQELDRQRQLKESLEQTIETLQEQTDHLTQTNTQLQVEVDDLQQRRTELEQFLAFAEAKKQELDVGHHPLQVALSQLHAQVTSLQTELHDLELQVLQRRDEKDQLEQQLTQLRHQAFDPSPLPATVTVTSVVVPEAPPAHPSPKPNPIPKKSSPKKGFAPPQPDPRSTPTPSISDAWTEFLVQLPDYELQVLRAIVNQTNPGATIRKIADDNLTTPEQLVAAINERAQEVVGDDILQPSSSGKPPTILREHLKTVKKLVKTREYLME